MRLKMGSGLAHRSRLMVPAVAAAHGRSVVGDVQEGRAEALEPEFSDPDDVAGHCEAPVVESEPQVSGVLVADVAEVADPDVAVALHTDHPHPVTSVVPSQLTDGFSGEGRGGNRRRPVLARVREDGPLRGEQQEKSPPISEPSSRRPVAGASMRVVDGGSKGRQQRGRVPLPPVDLRAVLAPVDLVWARLERPASRRLVEAAVRSELTQVEGFTGRTDAPKVLADRLARRLSEQLRTGGPINDPVGWLIGRGLPQRQQCGDVRCDDRMLLDSGRDCPRCEDRREDRRAQRRKVAADVEAALPHVSEDERRVVAAKQLHQEVMARTWARVAEREQVRARQAAVKARVDAAAWQVPADQAASVRPVVKPGLRPVAAPDMAVVDQGPGLILGNLTRNQVRDWRVRAMKDPQVVFDHVDRYGEASARRLFTVRLVDQVQRLAGLGHLNLGYIPWELS
ncbi:hypothetical protein [Streptomyces sp. DH1]|uniref:hypothetical protein n=1 Tax=Streptomyces sp. DH1 TaxID=2857012 RepID=UPI001E600B29|nr:hypothetical protein [Streptomyces sp. DH1]